MAKPRKVNLNSMDIAEEKVGQLKQLFPEAFPEGELHFDLLQHSLKKWISPDKERFGLSWPGKAKCMEVIQQTSIGALKPARNESVNFDDTENVFIEGDNLEVLKLLQNSYYGKVKMIYIDPPYNTGKEFIYSDKYNETLNTYLEYTHQKDSNGRKFSTNTETDGRYHSNWLNMMYPRLYLARNLLREDGVIFVSIDDNEVHNLRMVMNEIFGEENFVANFVWKKRTGSNDSQNMVSIDHDYVLSYSVSGNPLAGVKKDFENYVNPDSDPRGDWTLGDLTCNKTAAERPNLYYSITDPDTGVTYPCNPNRVWVYEKSRMERIISEGKVIFPKEGKGTPMYKRHKSEVRSDKKPFSSLLDTDMNFINTKKLRSLMGGQHFDHPKGVDLIRQLVEQGAEKESIILDFFAGSCTTAQAVLEVNKNAGGGGGGGTCKYICVQLPEPVDEKTEAQKAGYKTIADIGKERIRRATKQIKKETPDYAGDLGFKVFKLSHQTSRYGKAMLRKLKTWGNNWTNTRILLMAMPHRRVFFTSCY